MKMGLWKSLTEKKSALIGEDRKTVPQKCKALVKMLLLLLLGELCRILRGNRNFKPNDPFFSCVALSFSVTFKIQRLCLNEVLVLQQVKCLQLSVPWHTQCCFHLQH